MVDADDVVHLKSAAHALYPPFVARLFVLRPVVDGVAPQLARRRKIIGRHPRHLPRLAAAGQLEQLRLRPYVRRVVGDVQRQVADDADAEAVDVRLERLPLAEKLKLHELPEEVFVALAQQKGVERAPFAEAVGALPSIERCAAVRRLQRHEQGVFVKTPLLHKGAECGVVPVKTGKGRAQQGVLFAVQHAVIDALFARERLHLRAVYEAEAEELFDIDQVRVARSAEYGLIGRIAVARLHQGQHLPIAHARRVQKIGKGARLFAHRADAVLARQRRDMQQYARRALGDDQLLFHSISLSCNSDETYLL